MKIVFISIPQNAVKWQNDTTQVNIFGK